MFNGKKSGNVLTSTVIGEGIQIEGIMIRGSGGVRIDGEYIGDIEISGNITVGESGVIKGNIRVGHALIAGSVEGNVSCTTGVHLASTAKLFGNIDSNALVIDEGALFSGNCQMNGLQKESGEKNKKGKDLMYKEQTPEIV